MRETAPNSKFIEQAYRPPLEIPEAPHRIGVRFRNDQQLSIVNLTEGKTLFQKSITTDNELRFDGQFDLKIRIKLGSLVVGKNRIESNKLFKSSSLTRYRVELFDDSSNEIRQMQIEHYLPSFYPFIPLGIRITIEGEIVFERGKVPESIWSVV